MKSQTTPTTSSARQVPPAPQPDISDTIDSARILSDRIAVVLDHLSSSYFLSDQPDSSRLSHDYHRAQTFLGIASDYASRLDSSIQHVS